MITAKAIPKATIITRTNTSTSTIMTTLAMIHTTIMAMNITTILTTIMTTTTTMIMHIHTICGVSSCTSWR